MDGTGDTWEGRSRYIDQQLTMLSNESAIFVNRLDLKEVEVIKYNYISHEPWSNGSTIIETEILGGIIGGKPNSLNGIKAQFDSMANHRVNMAACGQILGVTVISDEEDTRRMHFLDKWQQGIEVTGG